jgi:hypothetical protein
MADQIMLRARSGTHIEVVRRRNRLRNLAAAESVSPRNTASATVTVRMNNGVSPGPAVCGRHVKV